MTTMLEKMAEAMWSVKLATDAVPGVEVPATEPLWLGLPDLERTRWRYRARAALQAIREVDQETYNAGWDAMTGEPDAGPGEPWLAMIDTILAEDKG